MYKPYPGYSMLHGLYHSYDDQHDAVIAATKHIETGEKRLHIIRNPYIEFWVTKRPFRTQNIRLECEHKSRVDAFVCPYKDMWRMVGQALGYRYPSNRDGRIYAQSPYLYGVDVNPIVRMKLEYQKATNSMFPLMDIGMLDIETSITDEFGAQILCASYTDWATRTTFEFINASWCSEPIALYEKRMAKELPLFEQSLNGIASAIWKKQPHTFRYIHCQNERELIIELIKCAILHKPDLCGVWNIGFDIPYIIKRAEFLQIDLTDLFCHPDIPNDLKFFQWREDKSEVEHFTDVWHQVDCPGYTRWYDPMCLYSRIRKVEGRENFYSLDYIGSKQVGAGKMKFGQNNDHTGMQTNDKVGYFIYNCFDTVLPCLIDQVTDDTNSMILLVDGDLSDFSKQTAMLRNSWFDYCLNVIDSVPGSVAKGADQKQGTDKFIWNKGGAVLNPNLLIRKGSSHLEETNIPTALNLLVNDIDATSMYPSIARSCNISQATKVATVLHLDSCPYGLREVFDAYTAWQHADKAYRNSRNKETKDRTKVTQLYAVYKHMQESNSEYIDTIFGKLIAPEENAVDLCHTLFALPDYKEMQELYRQSVSV